MIISLSGQCAGDRYKLFQSYSDEKVMNNGFLNEHRKKIMNCSLNEIRSQWTGSQTVLQTQEFCFNIVICRGNVPSNQRGCSLLGDESKRQQIDYPSPTWTAFPIVLSQQVATRDLWPDQHSQVLMGPQQPSQRPSLPTQRVAF